MTRDLVIKEEIDAWREDKYRRVGAIVNLLSRKNLPTNEIDALLAEISVDLADLRDSEFDADVVTFLWKRKIILSVFDLIDQVNTTLPIEKIHPIVPATCVLCGQVA